MFEDLIKENEDSIEKILILKSEYEALKFNVDTKQKLIQSMVTEIVALRLKIRQLESVLDGLDIDNVIP